MNRGDEKATEKQNSLEEEEENESGIGHGQPSRAEPENFQWSGKHFDTVVPTQRGVQEETSRISINSLPLSPHLFYIEALCKPDETLSHFISASSGSRVFSQWPKYDKSMKRETAGRGSTIDRKASGTIRRVLSKHVLIRTCEKMKALSMGKISSINR